MKVVIFAGGLGSRITEESHLKPKPMIEIGAKPILWHIMKIYAAQGFNDFVVCLGYKGSVIKEYFLNYYLHNSDVTVDVENNSLDVHYSNSEKFKVTLVDTGLETQTAGRLQRIRDHVGDAPFMLTYGDGVANIDLNELISFHKKHRGVATMTIVKPPSQFGGVKTDEQGKVVSFREKSEEDGVWINGGFFVLNPEVFDSLPENADQEMWEQKPLKMLTNTGQLHAYKHEGFWKCMDAMRDQIELDNIWLTGKAPWKIW